MLLLQFMNCFCEFLKTKILLVLLRDYLFYLLNRRSPKEISLNFVSFFTVVDLQK